jgi:N-acetylglucosaminyl-diphospho-decaprenol L-rhamnosyltransferase
MGRVGVVIVNWNSGSYLRACLESLRAQQYVDEIVVVDNGSSDDSTCAARSVDGVRLVEVGRNLGYAAAVNFGMEMTSSPYLLLANPDVEFCAGAVASLVEVFDVNRSVGLAGPRLINPDGSYQPSVRRFPTPFLWLFDGTVVGDLWPENPWRSWLLAHDWTANSSGPVDWLSGAVLMVRRAAVEDVGAMDPGYFMYSEELDWARRFREKGWLVWYESSAVVLHYGQISSSQVPVDTHLRYQLSRLRYVRKYYGLWWARAFRVALHADYLLRFSVEAVKWALGHRRALRQERMRVYAKVLASRLVDPKELGAEPGGRHWRG